MNRIMAPFAAPTEALRLQGKSRRVRGSVSFGGSNGLVCLCSSQEVLPQGGMAFVHHHGLRPARGLRRRSTWLRGGALSHSGRHRR
jgi:hypothetical protein